MSQPKVYDVIVVGAGISGANAAYILKKRCKNINILVLEAKERVGGRTFTIDLKCSKENKTSRWDIGGQWIGDFQTNVSSLLKELNIETYKQYDEGKKLLQANGKVSVYNSSVPCSSFLSWIDMQLYMYRVNKHVKRLNTVNPFSDPVLAEFLDKQNLKDYLFSKSFTSTVRSIFQSNFRTIYGLELDQVNTLYGLFYIKSGGGNVEAITYSDEGCAQEKRVKGGTQQIAKRCLEKVFELSKTPENSADLILNTAVLEVNQNEDDENAPVEIVAVNTVTGEKTKYYARKVISSIPVNQYINIDFKPDLPYHKRNCFRFFQIGNYIKFIVTYKHQFWRDKGLSGEGTFDGSVKWLTLDRFKNFYRNTFNKLSFNKKPPTLGAVAEVFDGTNEENEPALIGFIAAKAAVEWADQSDEIRRQEVIENLVSMYGPEARDYVDYVEKNWSYEPYNGGCPAFNIVSPGVMKDYARATREPYLNVHFCGTESATQWMGYMDGAVESGERAANEVLYTLYQNDKSIRVDYEKTFYHQKELIKKHEEEFVKNQKYSVAKRLLKYSLAVGAGCFIINRYKSQILSCRLAKLF